VTGADLTGQASQPAIRLLVRRLAIPGMSPRPGRRGKSCSSRAR